MTGFPITITETGGIAVTQVESGAPLATVSDRGIAVTLVDAGGFPLVIEGIEPAEPQTLFTEEQMTGLANAGDNSGYNLAVKIIPAADGVFTTVYFGKPTGAVQTLRRAAIYSEGGTLLRQGSVGEMTPEPAAGTRVPVSLSEPLPVTSGTLYVVQVTVNAGGTGGYAAQAGGFAEAVVSGDLVAPATASVDGNGAFNDSSGVALAFAATGASANYWVDVEFIAGDGPSLPTGYPTASNTGSSGSLPAYGGPLTISANDTTVENVTITGGLVITGSGVTIRNCAINYTDPYGIDGSAAADLTIENCTITGPGESGAVNAGILAAGTITGNKISGSENGIVLSAGAATVTGNYIFGLRSNTGTPHYDGISVQGGQNGVLIQHNTVISSDTSCIFLKDDFGAITDVTIDDNLLLPDPELGAPGFTIAIDQVTSITDITVTDNQMTMGAFGYYSSEISATISGNVNAYTGLPV